MDIIIKKTVLVTIATFLVVVGVALFLQSELGSDPISLWIDGIRHALNISIGNASLLNNVILLTIALVFARKHIHVGTVTGALLTGPMLNVVEPYVIRVFTENPALGTRIGMILIGQVILCIGIALNLATKFGFGTTDSIIVTICEKKRWKYKNLKLTVDAGYTVLGILLGGVFGVGSILGAVTGGPLIAFFLKGIDRTVIKGLRLNEYEESIGVKV